MAEPVLVVHGVANQKREPFEAAVADLQQRVGDRWTLIPAFWGDLGARSELVLDALPPVPDVEVRSEEASVTPLDLPPDLVAALFGGVAVTAVRSTEAQQERIVRGAAGAQEIASTEVHGASGDDGADAIRDAVREELPNTRVLQFVHDPDILEAVGRALRTVVEDSTAETEMEIRGLDLFGGARERAKLLLRQLDEMLGMAVGKSLAKVNQRLRRAIGIPFTNFFGDIFVYQPNHEQSEIHQRLRDLISERAPGYGTVAKPINVIAHSLGGVVTFDAAVRQHDPLHINGFITFGSQAAFFHILDPRDGIPIYQRGVPVQLPETIQRWTNLWEPMDLLAFNAGRVFRLANGVVPEDRQVSNTTSRILEERGFTHSSYWESEELLQAIQDTFA